LKKYLETSRKDMLQETFHSDKLAKFAKEKCNKNNDISLFKFLGNINNPNF
jgi:hypothetical protein